MGLLILLLGVLCVQWWQDRQYGLYQSANQWAGKSTFEALSLTSSSRLINQKIAFIDSLAKVADYAPAVLLFDPTTGSSVRILSSAGEAFIPLRVDAQPFGFSLISTNGLQSHIEKFSPDGESIGTLVWEGQLGEIHFSKEGYVLICTSLEAQTFQEPILFFADHQRDLGKSLRNIDYPFLNKFKKDLPPQHSRPSCTFSENGFYVADQYSRRAHFYDLTEKRWTKSFPIGLPGEIAPDAQALRRYEDTEKTIHEAQRFRLEQDWFWSFTHINRIDATDYGLVVEYLTSPPNSGKRKRSVRIFSKQGAAIAVNSDSDRYFGSEDCSIYLLNELPPKDRLPGLPWHYQAERYDVSGCNAEDAEERMGASK